MTGRRAALLLLAFLGLAERAAAEPAIVAFTEFYPVTRTENGAPTGPGLEIAKRLVEGLPVEPSPEVMPLRRMLVIAASRPMVIAALIRTPAREGQFQWIGELYRDSLVMVTHKPHRRIDSLEDARQLGHIGVTLGGIAETLLAEKHLTNAEPSLDMTAQARKLAGDRVDAWCALARSARSAWIATGQDPAQLEIGTELGSASIWVAASLAVAPDTVREMRRRFAVGERDGAWDSVLAELR